MPTLRLAPWVAALALAAPLHAQHVPCNHHDDGDVNWSDESDRYCEIRVERIPRPTGPLTIDGRPNGSIRVLGTDGDSIVLTERVETFAYSDSDARALAAQVRVVTSGGTIHAEGPQSMRRHNHWVVSFRVTAPKHSDLTLDTENGGIRVADITGSLRLTTINGAIALDGVGGDVHARGENGPLEIALTGKKWSGTGLDAQTENGPVELTLPAGYAAHLETGTVNGPMEINFPLTMQGRIDLKHLSTDIGGGGPTVRAVTTNGPVSVEKD
jgi:putative adhesin